jgi:hypothetical protein
MLLLWFIVLLALCLILIFISYNYQIPPVAIAGFVLLFLLGNVIMFSNLEVQSGYNEIKIVPCDSNCTYTREGASVTVTNTTLSYVYTAIPEEQVVGVGVNHILGLFLALIGVFGFIDIIINLKGLK